MNGSRYDGKPLVRLLECYVSQAIGYLTEELCFVSAERSVERGSIMRFRIEYISSGKPVYVLALQLDKGNVEVNGRSILGGVSIRETVLQLRALTRDGTPTLAVFVLHLCTTSDNSRLETDSIVELQVVAWKG